MTERTDEYIKVEALDRLKTRLMELGGICVDPSDGTYLLKIKADAWHAIFMTSRAKELGILKTADKNDLNS